MKIIAADSLPVNVCGCRRVLQLFAFYCPYGGLKLLLSICVSKKFSNCGKPLKVSRVDVSRAHFNAPATRKIFVTVPVEANAGPDMCACLLMSMYGTRAAAGNWEVEYMGMFLCAGYKQGVACVCIFVSVEQDAISLVHGDDFIALADNDGQQHLFAQMRKRYTIKVHAILGPEEKDDKATRILNRICRFCLVPVLHIELEGDPRRVELLLQQWRFVKFQGVSTPRVKQKVEDVICYTGELATIIQTAEVSLQIRHHVFGLLRPG